MAHTPARAAALTLAATLTLSACASTDAPAPTDITTATPAGSPTPSTTAPSAEPEADVWDVEACRLPNVTGGAVDLGQPRVTDRLPSTGEVRIAVIFADFSDAPASATPEDQFAKIEGTEEFYAAVSYGNLEMTLEPHLEWVRMGSPSTDYAYTTYESHYDFVAEAVALADPTFDFNGIDGVAVIVSDTQTHFTYGPTLTSFYGGGILADGTEIANAVTSGTDLDHWGYLWAVHELGHSLGLPDLYDYDGGDIHRHVGGFSVMGDIGGFASEPFAYSRWQLGWIPDLNVACHAGTGTEYLIEPVATSSAGTPLVLVPVNSTTVVAVESRRATGFDSGLGEEGVLVYVVDTSIPSGSGQVEVYPQDELYRAGALLGAGESVFVEGVEISVYESTAEGDLVYVGYAGE